MRQTWVTPDFTLLRPDKIDHNPGHGLDGDFFPDCTAS